MDPSLASTSNFVQNKRVSHESNFRLENKRSLQGAENFDKAEVLEEQIHQQNQLESNAVKSENENDEDEILEPDDISILSDIRTVHQSSECELCWPEMQKTSEEHESTAKARKLNREEDWINWIQCEVCSKWFHCRCVKVEDFMMPLIAKYHCASCAAKSGPSKMKIEKNFHRHAFYKEDQEKKPFQIGTKAFVENFKEIHMSIPEAPQEVVRVFKTGTDFMYHFNEKNEWIISYKVLDKKGLGLKMPTHGFHLDDVIELLGERLQVDTIDVYAQQTYKMSLKSFREVWQGDRSRLYNILSLEFSDTPLDGIVKSPKLARNLSWACKFWPRTSKQEELGEGIGGSRILEDCNSEFRQFHEDSKPFVEHFCLLGMEGSFTDFHIDFGGSSVWYHVYLGEKVFYIAMPTDENLSVFMEHQSRSREWRSKNFFGDHLKPGQLMRVHVKQGETLFIPSGVIHAVFTPQDSLVFGGNFLHCLNVAMQLRINQMEEEANLDYRWRFPQFELMNWYWGASVLDTLKEANNDENFVDGYIMSAVEALIPKLTRWLQTEQKGEKKPTFIKFSKILKELEKAFNNQKDLKRRLAESEGHESSLSVSDEEEEEEYCEKEKIHLKLKIKLPKRPKPEGIIRHRPSLAAQVQTSTLQTDRSRKSLPLFKQGSVKLTDLFGSRNQRSSHGRRVKPSAKVTAYFGNEQEQADLECFDEKLSSSKNFHDQFSPELLRKMAQADKEAEREEKAQRNLDEYKNKIMPGNKRRSGSYAEDKKPRKSIDQANKLNKMTTKQRLAKKLKIRT